MTFKNQHLRFNQDHRIAFVDLETTGLDPVIHEIVELAVICVDSRSLAVIEAIELRIRPEHLETADLKALSVCGFDEDSWKDAVSLREALETITPLLEGALIAGHNVGFDWAFLEAGFHRVELPLPEADYHRLDTASLAWLLVANGELDSMSLDAVAKRIGLERPRPHRAYLDAECALEVARFFVRRAR
jgi:DNA polymerase-3 subunit epsilon